MALFKTMDVTLALGTLRIGTADDRFGGVEPYVVPVFFKVDGERYLASLRINHAQQPRPGTTEQPGGQIQLTVDTFATGVWPSDARVKDIQEDNPFLYVPQGDLLVRGSLDSGDQVSVSDVSFNSKLIPISLRIDVRGTYMSLAEAFQGLLVAIEGELSEALNSVFISLDQFIGDLFGLNETVESCPDADLGSGAFLNDIDAQFKAMIPGTIGGLFVCMENDAFDEDLAKDLRSSVADEVAHVINNIVNALNLTNAIPEVERFKDDIAIQGNITSDLTWPAIADIGVSLGAIVASALAGNVPLGVYGILTGLSWAIGGLDDTIGQLTVTFGHSDLGAPGIILRSAILETEDEDDDNKWELSYTMMVNSIA